MQRIRILLNPVNSGILITVIMVSVFWHYYLYAITPPDDIFFIDQMAFIEGVYSEKNTANDLLKKQLRTLPDDWVETSPHTSEGWYQTTVMLTADGFTEFDQPQMDKVQGQLWAIYLPLVQMKAQIFINNVLVGHVGEPGSAVYFNEPFSRVANQPYLFSIPASLLSENKVELTIQVNSDAPGAGLLGKIYLAEYAELRGVYDRRHAVLITSVATITAAMLAIAILMSVLWALRRQDSVYGWYALTLYTWSIHNYFSLGLNLPITQAVQNIISVLALGWFIVFMVKGTHHYMGQSFPWREKIMLIMTGAGSLMIIFSYKMPWSLLITHQIWGTYVLLLASYVLLDFTVKFSERVDLQNPLVLPAGFSMLVFGLHDWMLLMQFIPRDDGRLLHFAAPVTVAVFGAILLERFAGVLQKAESHNLELEQRVAEKHCELESNFQRMREMEHQQLLTSERERFMKEIHDGVGGHLVSMLMMVRSGKQDADIIVNAIEAALNDLRLMIDSLSPQENDIPSLLGALRTRLEPQLKNSGLQLSWQVEAIPVMPGFGPHKALQVLRIVQEAVTNVIRHADATHIYIKAYAVLEKRTRQVYIEICDDGKGFADDVVHGKGLENMQYRANDIEAKLRVSSDSANTCVTLVFDL